MAKRSRSSPLIGALKEAITRSGLSVNQVAKASGVSQSALSRFIRGERDLSLPAAEKLVTFLGLTLAKKRGK